MTMDVAESLCVSWLRHEKACQIVLSNWTVSNEWDIYDENALWELKEKIENNKDLTPDEEETIFSKGNAKEFTFIRFFNSGETDVVGFNIVSDSDKPDSKPVVENCYGIDIAFHKDGLGYGKLDENIRRIIKKSVRTLMLFYSYLRVRNAEIIFAAPVVRTDNEVKKIKEKIDILNDILDKDENFKGFKVSLIAQDDFYNEIVEPIEKKAKDIHDTSELYVRSLQLHNAVAPGDKTSSTPAPKVYNRDVLMNKPIGVLVRSEMLEILENNITEKELDLLQDKDKSKEIFNLNYPVLVKAESTEYEKRRYYSPTIKMNDTEYKLCNHWFKDQSQEKLVDWIMKHQ